MPRKPTPKKNGKQQFMLAWLYGSETALADAFRKEASREYGEMERWMNHQIEFDPVGQLENYAEDLFPMIRRAKDYRGQIYDRTKIMKKLDFKALEAAQAQDQDALDEITKAWGQAEADQMALAWRIKKIHIRVTTAVRLDIDRDAGETDPFEEYVYNPEEG